MEVSEIKVGHVYRHGGWVKIVTSIAAESWHTFQNGRHNTKIVRFIALNNRREGAKTLEGFARWAVADITQEEQANG